MYAKGMSQRDISATIEDIFFISMDGVSGLEQGAKEIFNKKFFKICTK